MAQDYLAGSNTFCGNTGIGLQANTKVRCSATGSRSTDDLTSLAQGNGSASGPGQRLGTFGNHIDSRLEADFCRLSLFIRKKYRAQGSRKNGSERDGFRKPAMERKLEMQIHWCAAPVMARCE